jgi:benzodiazapine receptor
MNKGDPNMIKTNKAMRIAFAAAFTAAFAAFSYYFAMSASGWMKTLEWPAYMPPSAVFPYVWAGLYILLAVSFSLYAAGEKRRFATVILYIINGLLNPLWTCVFFARHNMSAAFFLLVGMFSLAVLLYKRLLEQNKTPALLLLPYILWLAFALYLNYETAFLN